MLNALFVILVAAFNSFTGQGFFYKSLLVFLKFNTRSSFRVISARKIPPALLFIPHAAVEMPIDSWSLQLLSSIYTVLSYDTWSNDVVLLFIFDFDIASMNHLIFISILAQNNIVSLLNSWNNVKQIWLFE